MQKYTKIQTIFKRCTEKGPNKNKIIEGDWTLPEFEALQNVEWEATEKIDGTNISVIWDSEQGRVFFAGRDENAQIPARLVNVLVETFPASKFSETEMPSMIIFGEGYGKGIQKAGEGYNPNGVDFMAFDIFCGGFWLERANIEEIVGKLEIDVVPLVDSLTLMQAVDYVRGGFATFIRPSNATAEGLVLRAPHGLLTRKGERLITKIKCKDFARR
jgi:hypothetical protein